MSENIIYKNIADKMKEANEKIEELKRENERLKQPQVFIDTQDMEERYGEELYKDYLEEQLKDYKSRCEKAIEYIKHETKNMPVNGCTMRLNKLIDILIGDKE